MKKQALAWLWLAAVLAAAPPPDPASFLPELPGWARDGAVAAFGPDNLFEHIDGAAENFLAYGFERLAVQNYLDNQKRALSAEIYFHGTAENAFGIYGSEKPQAGDYLQVGGQGYYEEGVLNFVSGPYYVKLNGFELGAAGREVLLGLAGRIAAAIGGPGRLPAMVAAFAVPGLIAHSERFVAGHFLGHEFLGPAFAADYELRGEKFRLFIMDAGGEDQARAMLRRYAALDRSRAPAEIQPGRTVLQDPYNGSVRLEWRGGRICGVIGGAAAAAETLAAVAGNLFGR